MTTYVALLRGINVGGRAKVRMQDLRELFVSLGHGDARTYIQTGNVIFTSSAAPARLAADIERRIADDLGLTVTVLLRTKEELAEVVAASPFAGRELDSSRVAVTFLADSPDQDRVDQLDPAAFAPEEFVVSGREVYVHCPDGFGRSKLPNFERKLGVAATARNWKVVTALLDLAS